MQWTGSLGESHVRVLTDYFASETNLAWQKPSQPKMSERLSAGLCFVGWVQAYFVSRGSGPQLTS
eukprot:6600893-Pyramimonas_sp.AAC.2